VRAAVRTERTAWFSPSEGNGETEIAGQKGRVLILSDVCQRP
jgi:hypothetical protein